MNEEVSKELTDIVIRLGKLCDCNTPKMIGYLEIMKYGIHKNADNGNKKL